MGACGWRFAASMSKQPHEALWQDIYDRVFAQDSKVQVKKVHVEHYRNFLRADVGPRLAKQFSRE